MNTELSFGDVFAILMIAAFIFLLGFVAGNWSIGYKQGQIDAFNGLIKYEIKTNIDNTTSWKKIK